MLQMEADDVCSASVATTTSNNNNNNNNNIINHNQNNNSNNSNNTKNDNSKNHDNNLIIQSVLCENSNVNNHKTINLYDKAEKTTSELYSPLLTHVSSAPTLQQDSLQQQQQQHFTTCDTHVQRSLSNVSVTPIMLRKSIDNTASLRRRVSFPKYDNELVTGYLEPANPWQHSLACEQISEIAELYERSCRKHNTKPLMSMQEHLRAIEVNKDVRQPLLCLKCIKLAPNDCEALEEIFKRVQYKSIDLSACDLDESAASALFEMIEYYEATNELDISANANGMTHRGWVSCTYMISHSRALQVVNAQGNPISKSGAENLGHALSTSNLHTIKLEHCGLKGAPLAALSLKLRHNRILKELWLAYNDLDYVDAENIADLVKVNFYLELLDISNNNIQDVGIMSIVRALLIQASEIERKAKARHDELNNGKSATFEVGDSLDNDEEEDTITAMQQEIEANRAFEETALNAHETKVQVSTNCNAEEEAEAAKEEAQAQEVSKTPKAIQIVVGQSMLDKMLSMNCDINEGVVESELKVKTAEENAISMGDLIDFKVDIVKNSTDEQVKNTSVKHCEEFDDTHSTDSAFESASEGDISRHLSEDYKRSTPSVSIESGIETGVIAVELNENLIDLIFVTSAADDAETISGSVEEKTVCQSHIDLATSPIASPARYNTRHNDNISDDNFMTQASRNYSQSTDSLCSDNSLDGSITSNELNFGTNSQLNEKLTKNDTLTRQQRPIDICPDIYNTSPNGLKALAIWNNNLTKEAGLYISDLLANTESLELLNIGKNCLSNDFVTRIKEQLTGNSTLTTLGLQSAHLSEQGIETLISILTFGGNNTLQRIDIRDNKLTVDSLLKIEEILKSNTTLMQIDIDDEPKRLSVGTEEHQNYMRILQNIRSMCVRNEQNLTQNANKLAKVQETDFPVRTGYSVSKRKISLTCYNRALVDSLVQNQASNVATLVNNKLEAKRKTNCRLRSPVPSPSVISPSSSPNRSRFQVVRVSEPCAAIAPTTTTTLVDGSPLVNMRIPSPLSPLTGIPSGKMLSSSPRSRFQVCRIYEDPKVPMDSRALPPITPPIYPPPTPMSKNVPKNVAQLLNNSPPTNIIDFLAKTTAVETNVHLLPVKLVEREESDVSETSSTSTSTSNRNRNEHLFEDNEETLTENSGTFIKSPIVMSDAVDNNEKPKEIDMQTVTSEEQRTRKTSWIANPATVDKLLNIFQNPAAFFQQNTMSEPKENIPTTTCVQAFHTPAYNLVSSFPVHKSTQWPTESFPLSPAATAPVPWCSNGAEMAKTFATTAAAATLVQSRSFLDNASRQFKDIGKQMFGNTFPLSMEKKLEGAELEFQINTNENNEFSQQEQHQ